MTSATNENLRRILTNLASVDGQATDAAADDNPKPNQQVLLRRPQPTYKKIYAQESLRAEFFSALVDHLVNFEQINLPMWLSQRIAWFYLNEFFDKTVRLDFSADSETLIEKASVIIYVKQNLLNIINEWLSRANLLSPTRASTNSTFSFDKPTILYDEFGIRNKRRTMEDKTFVLENVTTPDAALVSVYALFDGHCGVECAEFVSKHLPIDIIDQYSKTDCEHFDSLAFFRSVFNETNEKFNKVAANESSIRSGSTACVCLLTEKNRTRRLHVAWCGDSQFCLIKNGRVDFVNEPHKPSSESERARIEAVGGYVTCASGTWRINDTLAVSRSFGDCEFQGAGGLTCEPDVRTIELDGSEDYLILGCDGLFEHISLDAELCSFIDEAAVMSTISNNEAEKSPNLAELLVNRAKENGSSDNISAIFVRLK
jgi:serine/threonine protein phosphatase PrpC